MKLSILYFALLVVPRIEAFAPPNALSATTTQSLQQTPLAAKKKDKDETAEDKKSGEEAAKRAALDGVMNQIEKVHGRGSIVKLGEADNMIVDSINSGALTLDAALGGGYPRGRVVEIYGPESSGKTTLALHAIAESQKNGGTAAFIDAEHALDPSYAHGT